MGNFSRYEPQEFHGLSPLQITVDRTGERNVFNTKHMTWNRDGEAKNRINKEARVDIRKIKLPQAFKNLNNKTKRIPDEPRFYNEVKYVELHYGNEEEEDTNRDYLTDDNDEEPSEISTSVQQESPTGNKMENRSITSEEQELMSFVLKIKSEAEARMAERRKKWDQDLQEILLKSREELEESIQEASRQEEMETERLV